MRIEIKGKNTTKLDLYLDCMWVRSLDGSDVLVDWEHTDFSNADGQISLTLRGVDVHVYSDNDDDDPVLLDNATAFGLLRQGFAITDLSWTACCDDDDGEWDNFSTDTVCINEFSVWYGMESFFLPDESIDNYYATAKAAEPAEWLEEQNHTA